MASSLVRLQKLLSLVPLQPATIAITNKTFGSLFPSGPARESWPGLGSPTRTNNRDISAIDAAVGTTDCVVLASASLRFDRRTGGKPALTIGTFPIIANRHVAAAVAPRPEAPALVRVGPGGHRDRGLRWVGLLSPMGATEGVWFSGLFAMCLWCHVVVATTNPGTVPFKLKGLPPAGTSDEDEEDGDVEEVEEEMPLNEYEEAEDDGSLLVYCDECEIYRPTRCGVYGGQC
ncbi:hypothetical protein ON010_g18427 [Phytophthora cinnamomi]|nr:hypothetical protein ON010_g18427 [Phytophthora cinnamomi]